MNWVIEVWVEDALVSEINKLVKKIGDTIPKEGIVVSARREEETTIYA